MWGGVKGRRNYGDVFRHWAATKPLEEVRAGLFREPRPWYLAFSLHEHLHYLSDHNCSRLLSWCTSTVQLSKDAEARSRAYRYSQEAFQLMLDRHGAGEATFLEYMRLCAVGKDLTAAYQVYQHWLESGRHGSSSTTFLACLARVALASPSDARAEDMALAVLEQYQRTPQQADDTPDEERALRASLVALAPRVRQPAFHKFLGSLPFTREEAWQSIRSNGWPHRSHHHTFPHLEGGVVLPAPTRSRPALQDSLLHPQLVSRLEAAAFEHRVEEVIRLLKYFQERVAAEKEDRAKGRRPTKARSAPAIWRQTQDASATRFRQRIVESGGLTPELYHYLVVSLCATRPSAALRTLQRMEAAQLRVLDLTRAVMIVAAEGSPVDQMTLFTQQIEAIEEREKLDEHHETNSALEFFWKFDYVNFFHYQNALSYQTFYMFLMRELGLAAVHRLIVEYSDKKSREDGEDPIAAEDLVVLDADFRKAVETFAGSQFGSDGVHRVLTDTTTHVPQLDISLVGALPHFETYALPPDENIVTDAVGLMQKLKPFDVIYLLDASFIESSPNFLRLREALAGQRGSEEPKDPAELVLYPYLTLKQLARSMEAEDNEIASFDPALQEDIKDEAALASHRLHAIFTSVASSHAQHLQAPDSNQKSGVASRVLHFSECVLSQMVDTAALTSIGVDPETDADNCRMLLVLSLVRAVAPPATRVVLCSDDPRLNEKVQEIAHPAKPRRAERGTGDAMPPALFAGAIDVLSTPPPARALEHRGKVLVDDNPTLPLDMESFDPVLRAPVFLPPAPAPAPAGPTPEQEPDRVDQAGHLAGDPAGSPWLSLLEEDQADGAPPRAAATTTYPVPVEGTTGRCPPTNAAPGLVSDAGSAAPEEAWDVYRSPHDVVPVAEVAQEAATIRSLFHEFDVLEPEERLQREEELIARRSPLTVSGQVPQKWGKTILGAERRDNRGLSRKERSRLARGAIEHVRGPGTIQLSLSGEMCRPIQQLLLYFSLSSFFFLHLLGRLRRAAANRIRMKGFLSLQKKKKMAAKYFPGDAFDVRCGFLFLRVSPFKMLTFLLPPSWCFPSFFQRTSTVLHGLLWTGNDLALLQLASSPFPSTFDYATARYYTHYIFRDCKKVAGNNIRILQHSNGLAVVTLDPSHAAVTAGLEGIDRIEFGSSRNKAGGSNPSAINVVGKRKKNAMICHADMRLCTIFLKDGQVFPIPACVNGFILEFNNLILQQPQLAVHAPSCEGFIAIVDVNTKNNFSEMEKVWTATGGEGFLPLGSFPFNTTITKAFKFPFYTSIIGFVECKACNVWLTGTVQCSQKRAYDYHHALFFFLISFLFVVSREYSTRTARRAAESYCHSNISARRRMNVTSYRGGRDANIFFDFGSSLAPVREVTETVHVDDENEIGLEIPPRRAGEWETYFRRLLRLKAEEEDGARVIPLGCPEQLWTPQGYESNAVNNRQYSVFTFLPLSLYHQFKNFFNFFYLMLSLSQSIPALRVGFMITYLAPLMLTVCLSLLKEAVDETRRFLRDFSINREQFTKVVRGGQMVPVCSSAIRVGDLLVLHRNQRIPADCVLLHTTESTGTTFIRTDQLDGETDWKLRYPLNTTKHRTYAELSTIRVNVRCEKLHKDIYKFVGALDSFDGSSEVIGLENTLWTSCVVASGTILGVVIHTGKQTRSAMNSSKPKAKSGLIENELNFIGQMCFLLMVVMSVGLTAQQHFQGKWLIMIIRFFVLMSAMVPISMRVNIDVARLWYSFDISRDPQIPGTMARNSDLPEELGRIQYLFSDKTGTLTKNKMKFRGLQCAVDVFFKDRSFDKLCTTVRQYFLNASGDGVDATASMRSMGRSAIRTKEVQLVGEMMKCIILCHSVSPSTSVEDFNAGVKMEYQASSPDEVALVHFCGTVGVHLTERNLTSMAYVDPLGLRHEVSIVKVFPFTSERKCMGIILKEVDDGPGGQPVYTYYMKGADTKMVTVIYFADWLEDCCKEMATDGLRTLLFGYRHLTESQVNHFLDSYNRATCIIGEERSVAIAEAMTIIETDLTLAGVTGVEDELQDDVVVTLETLGMCGIKVWLLTGDKIETATCIGRSTRLIPREAELLNIAAISAEEAKIKLQEINMLYGCTTPHLPASGVGLWTLILDGDTLVHCLSDEVCALFVSVARCAHSIIVARCSPTQKAQVVQKMREHSSSSVRMAAIGDGGNDVAMILAANVGIGVEGVEGKQASLAADFSITKFSHCLRLIMWHGRNAYCRTCRLSQFIMHRGIVFAVVQAVFSVMFAGTTMSVFNDYLRMGYSTVFTMAPAFALVLDEDFEERRIHEYPQLYKELLKSRSLNLRTFLQWIWISLFQGGVMMYLSLEFFSDEMFQIVTIAFTSLLLTELIIVGSTAHLLILWKQRRRHFWLFIASFTVSLVIFFVVGGSLPNTFDRSFFFSFSCWYRISFVCLLSIGPLFLLQPITNRLIKSDLFDPLPLTQCQQQQQQQQKKNNNNTGNQRYANANTSVGGLGSTKHEGAGKNAVRKILGVYKIYIISLDCVADQLQAMVLGETLSFFKMRVGPYAGATARAGPLIRRLDVAVVPSGAAALQAMKTSSRGASMLVRRTTVSAPFPSSILKALPIHSQRRRYTESEAINPDEISFMEDEPQGADAEGNSSEQAGPFSSVPPGIAASSSSKLPSVFQDVKKIDTFSRGRVVSFIKRYHKGAAVKTSEELFETVPLESSSTNACSDGTVLYHSRICVPLMHPLWEDSKIEGGLWAHGVASDPKTAESLAAMHAEYIIDDLGYQIYSLPSMQRKHATAAIKAGRFASSPDGDNSSHTHTPTLETYPLPLRRVVMLDESENGEWQLLEVRPSTYLAPQHAILSPCVVDKMAEERIRNFFREKNLAFMSHCLMEKEDPMTKNGTTFHTATIAFPTELFATEGSTEARPTIVAKGKASSADVAITLACMHAELTLDALFIPLFPKDEFKQKSHAMSAWSFGRPAPAPGAEPKNPHHVLLPLPLKELVLQKGSTRHSIPNSEEDLVRRQRYLTDQATEFLPTCVHELTAIPDLREYLRRVGYARYDHPFFTEQIQHHYKSTVVLPVDSTFGICGGIGVASSKRDADILAAMHALDLLTFLGVPVKRSASEQKTWAEKRRRMLGEGAQSSTSERPVGRRLGPKGFTQNIAVDLDDDVAGQEGATPVQAAESDPAAPPSSPPEQAAPSDLPKRRVVKRAKVAGDASPVTAETPKETAEPMSSPKSVPDPPTTTLEQEAIRGNRQKVPTDLWRMEPDSPDGYIMVSPTDPATQLFNLDMAIRSPRQMNHSCKNRIIEYLAQMGRRFEDVFQTRKSVEDSRGGNTMHECIGKIPVPAKFGDRVAVGKAAGAADAEILAVMHTELILDTLGIAIFADPIKQQRHAKECAKSGRWAPKDHSSLQAGDTPSPPPLRLEYSGSLHWERSRKTKRVQARSVSPDRRKAVPPPEPMSAKASSMPTICVKDPFSDPNELNDIPDMGADVVHTIVGEEDLDLVAKARVQYYLRRQGKTASVDYKSMMGRGTLIHVASGMLPLPDGHEAGKERTMEGIATTKRDAEILAWVHAERTLDTLGIEIFDNLPGLQRYHAQRVEELGRWAPCFEAQDAAERKSLVEIPPLRLSSFIKQLQRPVLASESPEDWNAYITACDDYIKSKFMQTQNVFFDQERVPRTGDKLVDMTLDEVENAPIDPESKRLLQLYCNAAEMEYPTGWPVRLAGPLSHRVSWVTISIPGFPHIQAQGVGSNKEAAQRRAAMHALAILKIVDGDFETYMQDAKERLLENQLSLEGSAPLLHRANEDLLMSGTPTGRKSKRRDRATAMWDRTIEDFTPEGKERLVHLYSVCLGLEAARIQERVKFEDGKTTRRTVVELEDEEGKKMTGKGEGGGSSANRRAAVEDLFKTLSYNNPTMHELMELLRRNPFLDPEKIANVSLTEAQQKAMEQVISESESDTRSSGHEEEDVFTLKRSSKLEDEDTASWTERFSRTPEEEKAFSEELATRLKRKLADAEYQEKFAAKRQKLSISDHKDAILRAVENHPVLILCGTTGCGKTTQVPQFILDHYTEQGTGGSCSILVTQPRRISAVSIAQRVAAERQEQIGDVCGYSIRFDTKLGRCINFCTSGVLLRMLHTSPLLTGISVLIIDEIHERDINSDFILVLLQGLIKKRKDLRVILMSATLQAELFSSYFGNAPVVNVEGYVYPVQELFLEDLVPYAQERQFMTPLLKEAAVGLEMDDRQNSYRGASLLEPVSNKKYGVLEAVTEIDYVAIQFAIEQAERLVDLTNSSILVFLPGWDEIIRAKEILERNSLYQILPLHSSVGSEEQMQCFLPAEPGKRKVILSTNIAESGVTIDDIGAVIDVGRAKEKSYVIKQPDGQKNYSDSSHYYQGTVSQLLTVFASRANCTQRRGRVGRTRPGVCIRLYTRQHFNSLHDFQTPEMLRTPLDSLCLHIMSLQLGDPGEFLREALEPPPEDYIEAAMNRLHELGATTEDRQLTPLGMRLSLLPVEPSSGKMIIMGAVLKCLDAALTVASVTQSDVFSTQRDHREPVRLHRENFSQQSQSDAIASINGYNFWVATRTGRDPMDVQHILESRLLSVPQLLLVSRLKRQFFSIVRTSRFLGRDLLEMTERDFIGDEPEVFVDRSEFSENTLNVGLVKCVVASGLFPNIAMNRGKRLMRTKEEMSVVPSADSVVHKTRQQNIQQPFFVYNELSRSQESNRMHVRGLTAIPLWTILLMGTASMPITFRQDLSLGIVDGWIVFRASFRVLEVIRKFKEAMNICLSRKFTNPDDEVNNQRLDQIRDIVKDLVNSSFRPNNLVAEDWQEKGSIIDPYQPTDGVGDTGVRIASLGVLFPPLLRAVTLTAFCDHIKESHVHITENLKNMKVTDKIAL
eukprot:gene7345-5179_t